MKPIIISGGPGAGKTSIIGELKNQGYRVFSESSRTLIEQQSAIKGGVLPWTDLAAFAHLCIELMQQQKEQALRGSMPAFLDRAAPDICAYLKLGKQAIDPIFENACAGYFPTVFLCRPNKTIYQQDEIRPHSFAEAKQIHQLLIETYQQHSYHIVDVPWGSIEQRAQFILAALPSN